MTFVNRPCLQSLHSSAGEEKLVSELILDKSIRKVRYGNVTITTWDKVTKRDA